MTKRIWNVVLVLACLLGYQSARADFKDIKVDLTNGNLLTEQEIANTSLTTFGVAVGADGSVSRVTADDAAAAIVLTGKFHSIEHGWGNFTSTVKVDGPVKVSMGTCAWGGDVTVKNEAGETVASFNTNTGACYHNDKVANIASATYKGGAATLTISGGSYTPYIAVEAVDPADLVEEVEVSFGFGEYADAGVLPAGEKVEIGKTFTIPANFTMYQEGKTLTGWTDGSKNYEIGEVVTVSGALALTPVFVNNTVTLADRTDAVTLRWDFQRMNGAPTVGFEGKTGFWVTQAKIGTETIDVKLDFDTNNGGKIANGNWTDWAQMNSGTTFKVPSCKGAVVSTEAYSVPTTTTVDGMQMGNGSSKTPEFTCQGNAEFVDMVIGDGSYYRYIQVVLPFVPKDLGGSSFDNQEASVVWAFNNSSTYMEDVVASPEGTFAITSFDAGVCKVKTTKNTTLCPDIQFVCIASGTGAADLLKWTVKPVKGLQFTPTSISFYVGRDGTDGAGKDVTVRGQVGDGEEVVFAAITPHRNNKTQEQDKLGSDDAYTIKFEYTLTPEQQQALTSGEGFSLVLNNGYATTKALMVSDVHINGVLNGTVEAVEKFTLKLASNLEDACKLSVYPAADEYELGTEVAISAVRNFGYKFINWTDAAGNEVSTELSFKYVVNSATELTANFEKLTTYSLDYGVEGGANLYMVQPQPAPEVIDGKNMYEEGTVVTLTASGNDILTFTNWSDGGTFAETKVTMDGDKSLTAVYSAVDYIVGWDFYLAGANGRPADFSSTPENESATLVLRDAEGNTQGWLDKSTVAAGGYESFAGAAVNWKKLGQYYYQTKINARDFSNIKVQAKMMYNYNAYTTQVLEYSLDGETWNEVTRITMEGAKTQNEIAGALPAAADHAEALFIRWRPDLESAVDGTPAADNDGTAISAIYITADAEVYNDGVAPKLISSVPADNATGASSTGRIVLNFDEKVKLTASAKATLNGKELELAVSGKTVTANYRNLDYATEYVFNLAAGSVSDAAGNTMSEPVKITFTTMSRPTVAKAGFDKEVTNAAEFLAALEAANTRSDKGTRYRIFLHNGTYDLGKATLTGISASNISLIGESQEGVVIVNKPEVEGIGVTATLFNTSTGLYMQDITIKNDYPYANTTGRAVCLQDKGNKTVAKRVTLLSYQDTYYSNNSSSRFYWEDSEIHGTVDFLCGGGDVYYNRVNLVVENRAGNVIAAPNGQLKYGYVFLDCEINCPAGAESVVNGSYRLGRPWGANARAQYINTRMNVIPAADGWGEMGGNKPEVFAEYNSTDKNGIAVDLASRKVKFDGGTQASAVLTEAQVAELSVENVMGGSDEWNPLGLTEQAPIVTNLTLENGLLTWDNSDYAACWAVCRNGQVIAFTLTPEFEVTESRADDVVYSVRAANEMGGLGDAVEVGGATSGIDSVGADAEVVSTVFYNLQGIRVGDDAKGLLIKVDTLASGRTVTTKVIVK